MPIDLNQMLDQLEEWLEAQVPSNIHELPGKMLEHVERMSNDIIDSLNMHGPPSISIPFPPFGKDAVPPPPPPPPPALTTRACTKASKLVKCHPLAIAAVAGLGLTVTVGAVGLLTGAGPFAPYGKEWRQRRKFGTRGVVEDGMLKEAIVLLAPSPTPPVLVALAASLLKAGYVVVVAVPQVKEAEALERRLSGLSEKSALRVLIYDPEDSSTFPPFHRSLLATLTLRFPATGKAGSSGGGYATGSDPYNPQPAHIPHIHAFVSLYPLNPNPPAQPGALPALPSLVVPGASGKTPMLVTLYPSAAVLTTPDTFASQLLTSNHELLGANLGAATGTRVVSVFLGQITLPSLPAIITEKRTLSRREQARQRLRDSATSVTGTFSILRDLFTCGVNGIWRSALYTLGIGAPARDYSFFESGLLRILKTSCTKRTKYYIGQRALFTQTLKAIPATSLPRVLSILPPLAETGPTPAPPPKSLASPLARGSREKSQSQSQSGASRPQSTSSSDHEGGEDLVSSIHTAGTTQSSEGGSGLEGSWVGLDSAGA